MGILAAVRAYAIRPYIFTICSLVIRSLLMRYILYFAHIRAYCIRPDVGEHEMIAVNKSLRLFDFLTQDMSEYEFALEMLFPMN